MSRISRAETMTRSSDAFRPPPTTANSGWARPQSWQPFPGRPRRAALHGLIAQAVASAVTNVSLQNPAAPHPAAAGTPSGVPVRPPAAHQFLHAVRPLGVRRRLCVGAGLVQPALGAALAPVAAGVAYSRVHTGAHWPSDVLFGSAIGAGAALVTRKWWPVRPPFPDVATHRGRRRRSYPAAQASALW